ncbi:hypothetical protein Bca52824_001674 [Brassica carinata]|uniref:Pentatricopeptide repeat-containing protein n=1 Tax=Brassica carinata TaxID=52824 RepID=A0A8X7WGQ7_BRACI|nr:hypothetical protein Bca52824_001674 [Brassica carinata]
MAEKAQKTLILLANIIKVPPVKAFSLLNPSNVHGFQHTQESFSILLSLLLSTNLLPHAQSLLLQVISGRIHSQSFTPSSLLHYLTRSETSKPKSRLYQGLVPGSNCFNNLLTFVAGSSSFDVFWAFFNENKTRVALDVYSFGIAIKACCEAGETEKSFHLLAALREWVFTQRRYLHYFDRRVLQERRDRKAYLHGFDSRVVQERGYETRVRDVREDEGGWVGKGVEFVQELKSRGISLSVVTYNILVSGFCKKGDTSGAAKIVKEMEERGIKPSEVTYTILIDTFARSDNMEKAIQLRTSMENLGLVPDVHTYSVLIHGFCIKGQMNEASMLFRSMVEKKLEPNEVIYNTMILGYCKEGSSYRALRLLREMGDKNLAPNVASYSYLIEALCKEKKLKEAEDLVEKMIDSGMDPSTSICNVISRAKNGSLVAQTNDKSSSNAT